MRTKDRVAFVMARHGLKILIVAAIVLGIVAGTASAGQQGRVDLSVD